ncbi:unnamed protein product [Ectocarpus sp. 6 AP-2014]
MMMIVESLTALLVYDSSTGRKKRRVGTIVLHHWYLASSRSSLFFSFYLERAFVQLCVCCVVVLGVTRVTQTVSRRGAGRCLANKGYGGFPSFVTFRREHA